MAGLSQLRDGAVQARSHVRLRHAEHAGDLAVRESARELERDQVALLAVERRERRPDRLPAERQLRVVLRRTRARVLGVALQRRAPLALAQLVERRIAGNPEQPGLRGSAGRAVGAPLAVGALERLSG